MTLPVQGQPGVAGEPTLADLVGRVADGSHDAFRDLYRATSGLVYGVALRVVRDDAHAQEVVQETYLQIWQEAGRYDAALGSVRAWVLTLAHRRAVDRVRRESAGRTRETTFGSRHVDRPHDQVAEVVELRSEQRRVRAALDGLTAMQREAVELAYLRGLTHVDVAAELGIPLGTAKTRIRDGLLRLRDLLGVS